VHLIGHILQGHSSLAAIEYGLIAALIFAVAIGVSRLTGTVVGAALLAAGRLAEFEQHPQSIRHHP
jgi:Flp pilus assembly pilin Flp